MYLLGYDIGSSSVKAAIVEVETGRTVASDFFPKIEMPMHAEKAGWAEQDPEMWWTNLKLANASVLAQSKIDPKDIKAIGISWQMHGLVLVDSDQQVIRPSIIWCDSRAVPYGEKAFQTIGEKKVLSHLLNSPGNFTASKLAWVKENEPATYARINKIMLPGDYIAMKLTGEISVTVEGLSEGMFWDFRENRLSQEILDYFGFDKELIPEVTPIFGVQATSPPQWHRSLDCIPAHLSPTVQVTSPTMPFHSMCSIPERSPLLPAPLAWSMVCWVR